MDIGGIPPFPNNPWPAMGIGCHARIDELKLRTVIRIVNLIKLAPVKTTVCTELNTGHIENDFFVILTICT
jgi:hypothetical protein